MSQNVFNVVAVIAVLVALIGVIHGLLGFFYQFGLTSYLSSEKASQLRKISRVYSPLNPINFLGYVFNDEDCDDKTIEGYKRKIRYFVKVFMVSIILFGLLLGVASVFS